MELNNISVIMHYDYYEREFGDGFYPIFPTETKKSTPILLLDSKKPIICKTLCSLENQIAFTSFFLFEENLSSVEL